MGRNTASSTERTATNTNTGKGPVEVLSDTQGVNFGPYTSTIAHAVKIKWYIHIPQVARAPEMKQGNVDVEFHIDQKGAIGDPQIVTSSGDESLDDACTKAILDAAPFGPLPSEFNGNYLFLRFHFHYNPQKPKSPSQVQHP
ncbi:MAG TPA: TonB family protein [Terriglobales bacterium]|jgi:TonB family protein|nr:TonB family protein [Terriglobales bacterium]